MSQKHSLLEIFQAITTKKISGTLAVKHQRKITNLYFEKGDLTKISHSQKADFQFTDYLIKSGKVDPRYLQKIMEQKDNVFSLKDFAQSLEQANVVTREELEKLFREKISIDICDLFFQKESSFEFKKDLDECGSTNFVEISHFDIVEFLGELASQMGEWPLIQKEIPSTKTVFLPTAKFQEALKFVPLPNKVREESVLINGENTVEDMIQASPLGRFELLQLLAELRKEGGIEPLSQEEVVQHLEKNLDEGDEKGLLKYLQALKDTGTISMGKRFELAQAYDKAGKRQEAMETYIEIASQAQKNGQYTQGIEACQVLLESNKGDKRILFQLYKLYQLSQDPKAKECGVDLGYLFTRDGDLERAFKLFSQLYEKNPEDEEVNEALAEVAGKMGNVEVAKRCYTFLLDHTSDEGEKQKFQQALMMIDPSKAYETGMIDTMALRTHDSLADIGFELEPTTGGGFQEPKIMALPSNKSSSSKLAIFLFLLFIVLLGLYGVYELKARIQLQKLNKKWQAKALAIYKEATSISGEEKPDIKRLKEIHNTYKKIARDYKDYLDSYGWSLFNTQAIRSEQKHRQRLVFLDKIQKNLSHLQEEESRDIQNSFVQQLRSGKKLEGQGKFKDAFRLYFSLAKEYPSFKKKITLPLSVRTIPAGAQVYFNGKKVGKTPYFARVALPQKKYWTVAVKKKGFWSIEKKKSSVQYIHLSLPLIKNTLWYREISPASLQSPGISQNEIFFSSLDGQLYILDKGQGKILQKHSLGLWGDTLSPALVEDGSYYIGNPEGKIYRIQGGQARVIHQFSGPLAGRPLSMDEGSLAFLTRTGHFYGLNSTGEELFNYELKGIPLPEILRLNKTLYVGNAGGKIFAFDENKLNLASSTALLWQTSLEEKGHLRYGLYGVKGANAADFILIVLFKGLLLAFDPQEKTVVWKVALKGQILNPPRVVTRKGHSRIYLYTNKGKVYALDGEEGKIIWEKTISKPLIADFQVGEKNLYFPLLDQRGKNGYFLSQLLVLDRKTGQLAWSYKVLGKILPSPVYGDKVVYISTSEGYFYAIEDQ